MNNQTCLFSSIIHDCIYILITAWYLHSILQHFLSVKGLPTNFVVTTLIDKAALEQFEKRSISCSSCEEKLPATVRCTDCMDYLCSTCHIAHHRLRLTKGHQVWEKLTLYDIWHHVEQTRKQRLYIENGAVERNGRVNTNEVIICSLCFFKDGWLDKGTSCTTVIQWLIKL